MPYSINTAHHKVHLKNEFQSDFPFEMNLEIESGYNDIGISEGDKVVFLTQKEKHYFNYYGVVLNKEKTTIIEKNTFEENEVNSFLLNIEVLGILKENNSLEDLNYSLYKITNFKKPWKHFVRSYSFLYERDYKTIRNGDIFISRTAFGKFVNALHNEHKINFVTYFIENEPYLYFYQKDYVSAFKLLQEYIKYHILQPSEYIKESYNMLINLVGEDTASTIGFSDDNSLNIISKQINYMGMQNNTNENIDNSDEILLDIQNNINEFSENEQILSRYFEGTNWPIQI